MARAAPFEVHHRRYDEWFVRHAPAYWSELLAVRALLPWQGRGVAVGVGTGRFAAPLGVRVGIDPARAVLGYARQRGTSVVQGVGEALPFTSGAFDHALIVTTICFFDDAAAALGEVRRVLRPGGRLVIGFIDRDSQLGQGYLSKQAENVFYREATFFAQGEVAGLLVDAGFAPEAWGQTLSRPLDEIREVEPLRPGLGKGAFVVVRAVRE